MRKRQRFNKQDNQGIREEINKALTVLKQGGLILYPTDTVWGIGCDATNFEAVQRIYELKQREETKSMICLVDSIKMLQRYLEEVPEPAYDIIKLAGRPTTVIYDAPKHIAENIISDDNTLGIRIASDAFCKQLIRSFKKPIVSTSANISGKPTPLSFSEITDDILKGVDYVVNLQRKKRSLKASSIIKLTRDGVVTVIRK
ncbi:MAG: threonylcarbamoyl-AMP synthase [Bacteroidia bacterium]|nr:threonylcarbamoyl-AMP synthase [Bacteroidia bacterium]NNK68892.1 threonylcarbamoyl-AMP synthase [Flavobacteriaceae bacterium]NNL81467.1 threonylcarbamoyl-AMP synthase [Flavobacteriaceae bacterium]